MTRRGKCDICRSCKVKCDEARPACGGCSSRGRPCSYKAADTVLASRSVSLTGTAAKRLALTRAEAPNGLRLVTSVPTACGAGAFLKLTCTASASRGAAPTTTAPTPPARPLTSPESQLASRWVWAVGRSPAETSPFQIFGNVGELVPCRLGKARPMDLAVEFFLDSYRANRTQNNADKRAAQRSSLRAVVSLRKEFLRKPHGISRGEVLWCMLLHYMSEQLLEISTFRYTIHLKALASFASSRRLPEDSWDTFDDSLLTANYFEEIESAIASNSISGFDVPSVPLFAAKSPENSTSAQAEAAKEVMEQAIRLPRLIKWLRTCQEPASMISTEEVIELAMKLHENDPYFTVERALAGAISSSPNPEADPFKQAAIPVHVDFTSIRAFRLYLDYHSFRMILYGIFQFMLDLDMPVPGVDRALIEQGDVQSAQGVVAAVKYAMSVDSDVLLADLRMVDPLQYAFGSYDRLERRLRAAGLCDTDEYETTMYLRTFCLDGMHSRMEYWGFDCVTTDDDLRAATDAFAGGPPLPDLMQRVQLI